MFISPSFIASYLISTSNHNSGLIDDVTHWLLLISFLHQTTTGCCTSSVISNCFLSHFYIKPQLEPRGTEPHADCFLSHFYIKPQPGTATTWCCSHCFLSHFYIKPQQSGVNWLKRLYCFLSHFYIKPQLAKEKFGVGIHCFLSHFYIKPQQRLPSIITWSIASYLISTSNHN